MLCGAIPHSHRPGHLKLHRTFTSVSVLCQNEPRRRRPLTEASKPIQRPDRSLPDRRNVERIFYREEKRIEDDIDKIHHESRLARRSKLERAQRERAMKMLEAYKEILAAQQEFTGAVGILGLDWGDTIGDALRGTKKRVNQMAKSSTLHQVLPLIVNAYDREYTARVTVWRLTTFAPVSDVGVLARIGACFRIVYEKARYFVCRPILGICSWFMVHKEQSGRGGR